MPYLQTQTSTPDVNVSANDLASQIRAQVNVQLKQAGVSQQKAQSATNAAAQASKSTDVTVTKNGKTITIHTPQAGIAPVAPVAPVAPIEQVEPVIAGSSTTVPEDQPFDIPPRVENLGYAFLLMLAVIAVGKPLARAFGTIIERRAIKPAMPPAFGVPGERVEQGVDAASREIERGDGSQRYLLKVQAPARERVEVPRGAG